MNNINVRAALNGLHCEGRRPDTPEAELSTAFGPTIPYRDGFVSTVKFSGKSAWEVHPEDEVLFVVEGHGVLLIWEDGGTVRPQVLHPALAVVVPKGRWHVIDAPDGIGLMTVTPQPTVHSKAPP